MKNLLFLSLTILFSSSLFSQVIDLTQLDTTDPDAFCKALQTALNSKEYSTICFILYDYDTDIPGTTIPFWHDQALNCEIVIGEYQVINIPTGLRINLEGDGHFKLEGNGAAIKGDNFFRSRITNGTNGPAIIMDNCNGCQVSDITIQGDEKTNEGLGMTIEAGSDMNDVSGVHFTDLESGLIVEGSCNTFNDLSFFEVAIDGDDCEPTADDPFAVKILNAEKNTFTNINHTRSIGAISVWLSGTCENNRVLNLSIEQENSPCTDPSLFVDDGNLSRFNYVVTNYNDARNVIEPDDIAFKSFNIVLPDYNELPQDRDLTACNAPICTSSP